MRGQRDGWPCRKAEKESSKSPIGRGDSTLRKRNEPTSVGSSSFYSFERSFLSSFVEGRINRIVFRILFSVRTTLVVDERRESLIGSTNERKLFNL